jgi:hypothetical protein
LLCLPSTTFSPESVTGAVAEVFLLEKPRVRTENCLDLSGSRRPIVQQAFLPGPIFAPGALTIFRARGSLWHTTES